jgi:hypothetical protein
MPIASSSCKHVIWTKASILLVEQKAFLFFCLSYYSEKSVHSNPRHAQPEQSEVHTGYECFGQWQNKGLCRQKISKNITIGKVKAL